MTDKIEQTAVPEVNIESPSAPVSLTSIKLGEWNYYFIAKFLLFWRGLIGLHPLENLAFAAFLLAPITSVLGRRIRALIAVPLAIALLYYDSWLPPISRTLSQAGLLSSFSFTYLMELLGRFISWPVVSMLAVAWAIYRVMALQLRIGVMVFMVLLWLALRQFPAGHPTLPVVVAAQIQGNADAKSMVPVDGRLQSFYAKESQRMVRLVKPNENAAPFDVLFIHICSLSWDDLKATGLEQHPLWKSFDFILRNFNSAASYSGPAAIRINRALCGQTPHQSLYAPAQEGCYLMNGFEKAGFTTNLLLNHDGHFDDFLGLVQSQNFHVSPMPIGGLPIPIHAFDNSPIYDDLFVLNRWLGNRQKNNTPRVAAYYNTVTLHDGNHLDAMPNLRSHETYKLRLKKLLDDMDSFLQQISHSGRRTIVVIIPEHGAALQGEKMQISGLREIPSPAITLVPVGIRVIGPDAHRRGDVAQISESTSYLAVSDIISKMLKTTPFGAAGFSAADYSSELPQTEFFAENEGEVIQRHDGKYFLNQNNQGWSEYVVTPSQALPSLEGRSLNVNH